MVPGTLVYNIHLWVTMGTWEYLGMHCEVRSETNIKFLQVQKKIPKHMFRSNETNSDGKI